MPETQTHSAQTTPNKPDFYPLWVAALELDRVIDTYNSAAASAPELLRWKDFLTFLLDLQKLVYRANTHIALYAPHAVAECLSTSFAHSVKETK